MTGALCLTLTDYVDPTRWRWVLIDERGEFVADHEVRLDPTSHEYDGFVDLHGYLDYYREAYPPEKQLADLGAWIGEHLFGGPPGGVRGALWEHRASPAVPVRVVVPHAAQEAGLLLRPFELARFVNGRSFREAGIRFVYEVEPAPGAPRAVGRRKVPPDKALRVLAAFSLPAQANPLNLRRERYELQRLVRELAQTRGLAVELKVLQYGATRATLKDALEEGDGWDVVHLSGYGTKGALLLEDKWGERDVIGADELGRLLDPASARLKLLILDACYSGAGAHAAGRAAIGLDREPARGDGASPDDLAPEAEEQTILPSLAQGLAARLDCAALAMRYPVEDGFATALMPALYCKLLDKRRPLPAALHLALDEALAGDRAWPPLSAATPILVGTRAADLALVPPGRTPGNSHPPALGLGDKREPERFVGRLLPMLRASQALAPRNDERGVLFYGMPGAGKTTCALELAYRHAGPRFVHHVWYDTLTAGNGVTNALCQFLCEIETQLEVPHLELAKSVEQPESFRRFNLPHLRALLANESVLLVIDNVETLLTESGAWRDPLWRDTVEVLLGHDGWSRLVLTSRRVPAGMEGDARVQVETIHALTLAESELLARELPHLARLFGDEEGKELLQQTLQLAMGHPRLLELADGLAADRSVLAARVAAAADEMTAHDKVLDAFFASGGTREGETCQDDAGFMRALGAWTVQAAAGLGPEARLMLEFLCRLEPDDRQEEVVAVTWEGFLRRMDDVATSLPEQARDSAVRARWSSEVARDVAALVGVLERAGLVAVTRGKGETAYTVHPGVAEAVGSAAAAPVLDLVDVEVGDYYVSMFWDAQDREMEGAGRAVVRAARRGAPYLVRQERWEEALTLLEHLLARDLSPAAVGRALPLLRQIDRATAGTERELVSAGILAGTLADAEGTAEAEKQMREVMERAAARGEYHTAAGVAGNLVNRLQLAGRLSEALEVAEEKAGYTRRAGLGPWTQLFDETRRLQVLAVLGRYEEVQEAVEALRHRMEALPAEGDADGATAPWVVREMLLDTELDVAIHRARWKTALALNAEVVAAKEARGAGALEVARRRFYDYGPLLHLGRLGEARALLGACRAVFAAERDILYLGNVYSALADVENEAGRRAGAVRFQEVALDYKYQAGEPEACAFSHHYLADYLAQMQGGAEDVLPQRLAAGVIWLQTQSGRLSVTLNSLAGSDLPPAPPTFDAVAERVESIKGVRFRELFARLPQTVPDGDAAIAAVWGMVGEEKRRLEEQRAQVMAQLEPLLQAIAAAVEDEGLRAEIEQVLTQLEGQGWMLMAPVQRIWAGQRDAAALTAGLDDQDSAPVRRVLALVGGEG